jgi:hypothetical protein
VISALFTIGLMWSWSASAAPHTVKYDLQDAWKFACSTLKYDCSKVLPPQVFVYAGADEGGPCGGEGITWGATPYNNPSRMVALCETPLYYADPVFVQSVLAHEIAHYLDDQLKVTTDRCETENNGHRVGNAYVVSHGHPEWADYDWQDWYKCYKGDENGDL